MPRERKKLRNGTWIVPGTGERSRRQFTLRHPNLDGPDDDDHLQSLAAGRTLRDKANAAWHNLALIASLCCAWVNSPKGRGTIKCSIAYLLASMGTFWHPAAKFLGPQDGKHIVATISVYFHPARSAGSQMEAVAIAVIAVCYAMFIGTLSMATSVLIGSVLDMVELSYVLILIVFIGGGLGFVGWIKQKLNNPLVSVGASIASIGIITIVTKENSVHTGVFTNHKIIQSLKILLMATSISTLVNLVLWPVSAIKALRTSMRTASTSLGDMLTMISHGFLAGNEADFTSKGFTEASSTYSSSLAQMNKNAREAKFEYYLMGREKIYRHDKAIVKSMELLAQSLGGLRSAANTQFELLKEKLNMPPETPFSPQVLTASPQSTASSRAPSYFGTSPGSITGRQFSSLAAIHEAPDERSDREDEPTPTRETPSGLRTSTPVMAPLRTPADIFELFIERLGPSMKSLSYTMAGILKEPAFGSPGEPVTDQSQFKESLEDAISLFNQARGSALEELYKTIEFGRTRPEAVQADFEEVAAACGHFSFSLLSFGDEMLKYLDAVDDLSFMAQLKKRSWEWMKFWKRFRFSSKKADAEDPEQSGLLQPVKRMRQSKLPRGIPDTMLKRRDTFAWDNAPSSGSFWSRTVRWSSQTFLGFMRFLAKDDIRFGLKVGIGATLYAMFAFIPQTRPIYQTWRGEWGLLSFMIVCSMTVGASNSTGLARFTGTIMGAAFVLVNWGISNGNVYGLAFLGWLVSFGAFYIMVDRGNGPFGRFILLSYNVSSLYAYSLTQRVEDDDDDEGGVNPLIAQIAFHRVIAVSMGIIWGLIICRLIWPVSARRKFKEGLSVLYLQMGLIWKRGPLAILLRSDSPQTSYMRAGEQAALQRYTSQLQTLRSAANNEYELRGPFPFEAYGRVMNSTQRLLDAFHAMNLVTQKHGRLSIGEKALLYHTAKEREELCSRICHVFQVLASSVQLEYPLSDAVPTVAPTRDRLLGKVFRFRKEHTEAVANASRAQDDRPASSPAEQTTNTDGDVSNNVTQDGAKSNIDNDSSAGGQQAPATPTASRPRSASMLGHIDSVPGLDAVVLEEPDYALLYAYALVTGQVAKELSAVEHEIEALFGRLDDNALLLQ